MTVVNFPRGDHAQQREACSGRAEIQLYRGLGRTHQKGGGGHEEPEG